MTQYRPDIVTATTVAPQANRFGLAGNTISSLITPQQQAVSFGNTLAPKEAVRIQREDENQRRLIEAQRMQQALDAQATAQGNLRSLYAKAQDANNAVGAQAYNRIDQDLRRGEAAGISQLVSRGLGNSTITSTVQRGYRRDAEDARRSVDEQMAARKMGLLTGLADRETQYGGNLSNTLLGQKIVSPDISGYVAQKQSGGGLGGILGSLAGGIAGSIGGPIGTAIGGRIGGLFG